MPLQRLMSSHSVPAYHDAPGFIPVHLAATQQQQIRNVDESKTHGVHQQVIAMQAGLNSHRLIIRIILSTHAYHQYYPKPG